MTFRSTSSSGRICVISKQQFDAFRDAAKRVSEREGHFVNNKIIENGRPKDVPHPAFSFAIFDQNRLRGFSAEKKPGDEKPTLQSVIHLTPMDQFLPLYKALFLLLQCTFRQKDIGPTIPSAIYLIPKPVFEQAHTDLLMVHNALSLTIVYADRVNTDLRSVLSALVQTQFTGDPTSLLSWSSESDPSFRRAIHQLRDYTPITELLPLIANKE